MLRRAQAWDVSSRWLIRFSLLLLVSALMTQPTNAQNSSESKLNLWPEAEAESQDNSLPAPNQHLIPIAEPVTPDTSSEQIDIQHNQGLISLMVRDASLRQVVSLIAETQKLNIVFASPGDERITASFDQVPWQQALDSLLAATGYAWNDDNGILFISQVENASQLNPRAGGRRVRVFELDFAMATDVHQTVEGLLSPAGKSWVMESSADNNLQTREVIAVVDYPAHLEQIADYICQADQPPRQVLIEANILQVQLQDDCRSGIRWEQLGGTTNNQLNFGFLSPGVFDPGSDINDPGASNTTFLTIDTPRLNSLLEALKTTTDAKTLASPKVLAVSGQQSRIQIGEKLGYRVTTTTQTSSLESVEFLDVGVVLSVTPRITRDGRVLMQVKPEVSTGQVVDDLPEEQTTEVETDLLLANGQGMVIGGLIQEEDRNVQNKVPWLGDLPYVGILFQKREIVKERSEIIVTLVPHLLPYTPIKEAQNAHELMRTQEPLTYGPLNRYPRPYEPQLPDTFTNPRVVCPWCHKVHHCECHADNGPGTPMPLPTPSEEPALHFPPSSLPYEQQAFESETSLR